MPGRFLVRWNSLHQAVLGCLMLVPFFAVPGCAASDWNYQETRNDARDFVVGGFVHVRLNVGDMHVRRGDTNKISMHYTIKSRREKNLKEATVDFDVHGNNATIEFHASGGNTQFEVELEVPQNTNLDVHAKVGDVTVEDVEGDKDLSLGVGDIRVENARAGYRVVNASTGIGDVSGEGYGETSGWLGKTLKYHGEGKYELRAHVGVGDIHLEGK
jgi:Putative adhesin